MSQNKQPERTDEKLPYEAPAIESVKLTDEAAEAMT